MVIIFSIMLLSSLLYWKTIDFNTWKKLIFECNWIYLVSKYKAESVIWFFLPARELLHRGSLVLKTIIHLYGISWYHKFSPWFVKKLVKYFCFGRIYLWERCVNAKIFLHYFGPLAPFFVKLEVLDRFLEFYWLKSVNFARNFEIFLTFLKNEFQNKILVLN